jgi:hypothetical protein
MIAHERVAAQNDPAGGRDDAAANIAESIVIMMHRFQRAELEMFGADEIVRTLRMDAQHQYRRCRLRAMNFNIEADADFQSDLRRD